MVRARILVRLTPLLLPLQTSACTGVTAGRESFALDDARVIAEAVGPAVLFERVAEPSPHLSDFFGIQVLAPVSRRQLLADLVPAHARLLDARANAVHLLTHDSLHVTVFFDTELELAGATRRLTFARIGIDAPERYPEQPARFRALLERAGLAARYLLPNPHFAEERLASARMATPEAITAVMLETDTAGFGSARHAAIFVGETHGGTGPYERALALLRSPSVEWLGIEMLPVTLQAELDTFLDAPPATPELARARAALIDYYALNWNSRGHEVTAEPAANPYFRMLEAARSEGKRVYALDASPLYILFRFGEFPLGAATRDVVWARSVPASGRGLVYGGSSHFAAARRPNMLTFLRERFPAIPLYVAPPN